MNSGLIEQRLAVVRSVGRALAVFDAFDAEHMSLSLQDIGLRIGMPKATTFRIVNTLERSGFLVRLDGARYGLSLKIVRLANLVRSTIGIRDTARPAMMELARATGETVTLNTIHEHPRLCIDVIDTPSPLMTIARPGQQIPLLSGATGRVLLAYRSDEEVEEIIAQTPGKKVDRNALLEDLAKIRRLGYALSSGQRVSGISAIAVPLPDSSGDVTYALGLTGPSVRMDPPRETFIGVMLSAGAQISGHLCAAPAARALAS